ncbi:unnamed protein product, partial [marine sediment metagenome]
FATGAWLAYKTVLIATNVITKIYTASTVLLRIAQIGLAGGITNATRAFKLFSAAIKASPLGIFLTVLSAAVLAYTAFSKSVKETRQEIAKGTDEFLKQREESEKLNDQIKQASLRYEELKSKTELTKKEQKELNEVIKLIAKNVPDAVTEVDKYGDALAINTKKTNDFIKLQEEINDLDTEIKLKENKNSLKQLNKEIEKFTSLGEKQNSVFVQGVGRITKTEEGLKKIVTIQQGRNNTITEN